MDSDQQVNCVVHHDGDIYYSIFEGRYEGMRIHSSGLIGNGYIVRNKLVYNKYMKSFRYEIPRRKIKTRQTDW